MKVKDIPLDQIRTTGNVRTEPDQEGELAGLAASIEKYDLLQPVLVIQRDGYYELVAGHRRLAAYRMRHEATIPAMIRDDISARDIPYLKLIENIQRKDMSPREVAAELDSIKASHPGMSAPQIAKLLGKSDAWVYDTYLAAKTFDELLSSGMSEDELRAFSRRDLAQLGRVKDRQERLEAAKESRAAGGQEAIRAARRVTKRGGFVDRSGGIAIMGGGGALTCRVVCDSQEAMKDVLAALLGLKRRRVRAESKSGTKRAAGRGA